MFPPSPLSLSFSVWYVPVTSILVNATKHINKPYDRKAFMFCNKKCEQNKNDSKEQMNIQMKLMIK